MESIIKKALIRTIKTYKIYRAFIIDGYRYQKCHSHIYKLANEERNMLLTSHALEKGMTFKKKKNNWGIQKSESLCASISSYTSNGGDNTDIISLALNVLEQYIKDPSVSIDSSSNKRIQELLYMHREKLGEIRAGAKKTAEPPLFDTKAIKEFLFSRQSIRTYSKETITQENIKNALEVAACTPTACNRQTSKVYAFQQKEKIKQILDLQKGGQGWCESANTLFIVTGVLTYFAGIYERTQIYVDGGLFAMNLVYGLHLQHIASCFKMFVRDPDVMSQFREICLIPENEEPIVLILAGHYPKEETTNPVSHRFPVKCVLDGKELN